MSNGNRAFGIFITIAAFLMVWWCLGVYRETGNGLYPILAAINGTSGFFSLLTLITRW